MSRRKHPLYVSNVMVTNTDLAFKTFAHKILIEKGGNPVTTNRHYRRRMAKAKETLK